MRLVIQRVLESSVRVDGNVVGSIGPGFMVLCGVEDGDTAEDVRYCIDKTVHLRIFEDEAGMHVETGIFQTDMKVSLINDGPVTLLVDSRKVF